MEEAIQVAVEVVTTAMGQEVEAGHIAWEMLGLFSAGTTVTMAMVMSGFGF